MRPCAQFGALTGLRIKSMSNAELPPHFAFRATQVNVRRSCWQLKTLARRLQVASSEGGMRSSFELSQIQVSSICFVDDAALSLPAIPRLIPRWLTSFATVWNLMTDGETLLLTERHLRRRHHVQLRAGGNCPGCAAACPRCRLREGAPRQEEGASEERSRARRSGRKS